MWGNDLSRRSLKKEESFKNEKGVSENASFAQISIGADPNAHYPCCVPAAAPLATKYDVVDLSHRKHKPKTIFWDARFVVVI